jgi:hypothetical protein
MKSVFSYLGLGGILIGAFAAVLATPLGSDGQRGQKKEPARAVMVEKRDHGRNGTNVDSTRPQHK